MIGLKVFHQLPGDPFCLFPIIEFFGGKGEAVVRAVVNAEDLEARAVLVGMGKNDCGHDWLEL